MTISALGSGGALPQSIVDLKAKMAELQTQLGTGRKAVTYGGLGSGRSLALGMRAEIAHIQSFRATITTVSLRFELMGQALKGVQEVIDRVRGAVLLAPYEVSANGKTQLQYTAEANLAQLVQLYNSQVNNHFLFAGRESTSPPVAGDAAILEGSGARAGFRQVMAERWAADRGADGLGRLAVPAAVGPLATIAEDGAGHPFGFKITGVNSALSGTTVTGPAGATNQIGVTFSATLPSAGETIVVEVALPDGTSSEFRLTATASSPVGAGQFAIGVDENATATNFQAALATEVARVAGVDLAAASAVEAADDFFDANPPMRVAGANPATATALTNGTTADTVFWYKGDTNTPARQSAIARVDEALTVDYGARADEAALRNVIKQTSLIAALRFDVSVATDHDRFNALNERIIPKLAEADGGPKVSDIATDLAQKHTIVNAADARHKEALAFANITLDQSEGVNLEEVGVQFLRLQTQLQASYETTAILSRLSLVNFL